MDRDPSIFIMLTLDTNLEVTGSCTGMYDEEGVLTTNRLRSHKALRQPLHELDACLTWGADTLNSHWFQLNFNDVG